MMVGLKILSISGHKTASKHGRRKICSTSRLAIYDGVTAKKTSNRITDHHPYQPLHMQ
jgi:hypothetical protein